MKRQLRSGSADDMSSRRAILAATGAGIATAISGCLGATGSTGGSEETTTEESSATATTDAENESTPEASERQDITYRGRFKRVGLAPAVNDGGIALGAWREQGLDVEYVTSSGAQAAAKSVASGKEKFGNGGIMAVLQLIESGAPLVVLGQVADPMGGVVSLKETGIESWTDLEGKVVGMFPFGSTGPAAKTAMRTAGVDVSKVTFQNVQPGAGLKLLLHGELDAMIKYFPQMQDRLEAEGEEANVLKTSDVLDHLGVTLYTRREVVENEPDLVDRFTKGWLNAFQLWATNVDEVIDVYKPLAAGEFDEELERRTLGDLYASQVPPKEIGLEYGKGWTPPEKLRHTVDIAERAGLIEGNLDPETVYTNRFIEQNQELAVETAETLYETLQEYDAGPNSV
ncbi:ABC transporter substrate-binding protein [Haloferax sp. YSSS75]|uniref:ABC transporter substrate-binding protein n=1 Tax=Haloferax sp. YSSS75 TaxID=3388564 RepID=UPI00398CA59F